MAEVCKRGIAITVNQMGALIKWMKGEVSDGFKYEKAIPELL